jgi:ABC-type uncharacterized transport system ATPase subunit
LRDKPSRKLTDQEVARLFEEISSLVDDGYALRELQCAMKVAGLA